MAPADRSEPARRAPVAPGRRSRGRTEPSDRTGWALPAAGVAAVLLIGAVGTVAAVLTERDRAAVRDRQAATVAAAAISDRLARSTTALAGVNGLAADGVVTDEEFQRFATAVLAGSALPSVAHDVIVTAADRAAFEQHTGRPITERDRTGGFVPAGTRPEYVTVVDVVPSTDLTRATLGFDIGSDPVRAAAAAEAQRTRGLVLSEAVALAPSGRPGFFVIQPIFASGPDGRPLLVGYVSTGLPADDLLAAARERLPAGTGLTLADGALVVAGPGGAGASAPVLAAGRTLTVRVHEPTGPDPLLPIVVGGATLLIALVLGAFAARGLRFDRAKAAMALRLAEDAARSERLADVARRLSAAEHLDDVVGVIEAAVPGVVGADVADVGLLLEEDSLSMLGAADADAGPAEGYGRRYRRVPLKAHLPTTEAVRERRTVLVPDLADYQRAEPALLAEAQSSGLSAAAATPLLDAAGVPIGVLGLGWRAPVRLDGTDAAVIRTVGELCAQTLGRARAADRRHAFIAALQRRLLPDPPEVPGLRILARYQPAGAAVGMGGDWYQFLPQPDGSLVVVVGDVAGHGVEAIAVMAQIQHVLAAAVNTGVPLERVFAHTQVALESEAAHATVVALQVDPVRGRVGYVSAGHPYPLIRQPDGAVSVLDGSQQPMLGLPAGSARLAYAPFPPGAALLAYTDGLIERRTRTITDGIAALGVELARLDPGGLPDALDDLLGRSIPATPAEGLVDDDVAVVLLAHTGLGISTSGAAPA